MLTGEEVELGKRNWQLIVRKGSVAILNRIDDTGLVAKGILSKHMKKMKELAKWMDNRRKSIPGRENSKRKKGLEAGACPACGRNSKAASRAGGERVRVGGRERCSTG